MFEDEKNEDEKNEDDETDEDYFEETILMKLISNVVFDVSFNLHEYSLIVM